MAQLPTEHFLGLVGGVRKSSKKILFVPKVLKKNPFCLTPCIRRSANPFVVWYGIAWYGMMWYWCGMVCFGKLWCGMVWYGMLGYGMVWDGTVRCGTVWYDVAFCGMVWYDAWYGMAC